MYRLTDSERANELDIQINMMLSQANNIDNPYTQSEYRALMHQIDRLTIKRDLLYDRINLQREKEENNVKNISNDNINLQIRWHLFLIIIYVIFILIILY